MCKRWREWTKMEKLAEGCADVFVEKTAWTLRALRAEGELEKMKRRHEMLLGSVQALGGDLQLLRRQIDGATTSLGKTFERMKSNAEGEKR